MTSRQRLLAAARCAPCDRIPVSPFTLGRLDPDGKAAARLIEKCDVFLSVGLGVHVFGGASYEESRREEGPFTIITVHTPRGPLTRTIKKTSVATHLVEFPCKGPKDVEKFLSIPFDPQEPSLVEYHRLIERWGEDVFVLADCPDGICLPAELLSPEDFCLLWADAPDFMADVVEEAARRVEVYAEAACRAGVAGFRIIGGEYVSVQLGPKAFERLAVGPDRRLVGLMHRFGALVYYHNHGPVMRYLDAIAQIGVDYLDPVEMPTFGDADLARAREVIDGRFCIVGTFDDMEVLEKLPAERLIGMARQRVEQYGTRGFCIGGSASGTYGERAVQAFCALADWAAGPAA